MCGVWLSLPVLFLPSSRIRSRFLPLLSVVFFPVPVCSMEDCSCGCLAKMARIADGCVYESGLELTQTQRRGQLSCLLYSNHGFRAPYVCRLTVGDLKESYSDHQLGYGESSHGSTSIHQGQMASFLWSLWLKYWIFMFLRLCCEGADGWMTKWI